MSPSSHARPSVDPARDAHDTASTDAPAAGHARPDVEIDPTPALAQDVLALFRGPFADVRFPDVDRDSLEADALALLRAQAEVEALDRAIEEARQEVKARSEHLLGSTGRALAYAKVFALGQPALEDAVARVRGTSVDASAKTRAPKKKRGARAATGVQLPISAPTLADDVDADAADDGAEHGDAALESELAAE